MRDGSSERPNAPSAYLSLVKGHSSSTPPPTFVVAQSKSPCDANASP